MILLGHFARSLLDLAYPRLCLHCDETIKEEQTFLCTSCLEQLTLIDARERCPLCFKESEMAKQQPCLPCRKQRPPFDRLVAAFERMGPAETFLRQLRQGKQTLVESAAAYMATQWIGMQLPLPDLLVPVPYSWFQHNPNRPLAEALGKIFNRPILSLLCCDLGNEMYLKGSAEEKRVMLIDLVDSPSLKLCPQILADSEPKTMDALVFCIEV